MTLRCVAYAVNAFHNCIHRCIVADGIVCAVEVVVYRTWQTYAAEIELFAEFHCSRQRAISADNHQGVYVFLYQVIIGFLPSFYC